VVANSQIRESGKKNALCMYLKAWATLDQTIWLPFWKLLDQDVKFYMSHELIVAVLPLSSLTRQYLCNSQHAITSFSKEKRTNSKILSMLGKIYILYRKLMLGFPMHVKVLNKWVKLSTPHILVIWHTWLDYRFSPLLCSVK